MRARLAVLLMAALASATLLQAFTPAASADVSLAQQDEGVVGEEDESQQEGTDRRGGEGQSDPEAETGAGEGETEGAAEEEGPPWTYQMARLGLVILALMGAGLGLLYYRLIVIRQRGEV